MDLVGTFARGEATTPVTTPPTTPHLTSHLSPLTSPNRYEKYKELGKKRKADHYQRLIVWYPPLPPGHKILRGYYEALEEEYKGGVHQV